MPAENTHIERGRRPDPSDRLVFTIGVVHTAPTSAIAIVPGEVTFCSDIRSLSQETLDGFHALFEEEAPKQQEVIIHPWEKLVVTEDLLNRCQAAVQQVKTMVVPGWTLGQISCSASGLSTTWTMQRGQLGSTLAFKEPHTPSDPITPRHLTSMDIWRLLMR